MNKNDWKIKRITDVNFTLSRWWWHSSKKKRMHRNMQAKGIFIQIKGNFLTMWDTINSNEPLAHLLRQWSPNKKRGLTIVLSAGNNGCLPKFLFLFLPQFSLTTFNAAVNHLAMFSSLSLSPSLFFSAALFYSFVLLLGKSHSRCVPDTWKLLLLLFWLSWKRQQFFTPLKSLFLPETKVKMANMRLRRLE